VIGQWLPLSDPRPSVVLHRGFKWIGPTWANIDANNVLTYTPTKTENTSAVRVHADLSKCPMVLEEIARLPPEKRVGPLIVAETTGRPYSNHNFHPRWRLVANHAGIPNSTWNRDLKAGGVTEGSRAGASTDDLAKLAAHSNKRTTAQVYDRDVLEATRRVSDKRKVFRENQ
jgi:integrase